MVGQRVGEPRLPLNNFHPLGKDPDAGRGTKRILYRLFLTLRVFSKA
jgi:hypothetical protein